MEIQVHPKQATVKQQTLITLMLMIWFIAGMCGPVSSQAPQSSTGLPDGFEIERTTWKRTVPPDGTVTVENRFGNVDCRFGGYEDQAEFMATLQHFDDEGPRLEMRSTLTKTGVVFRIGYDNDGKFVQERNPQHLKRADIVIFVPLKRPLFVITTEGDIGSKGVKSPLRAQSTSGNITIKMNKGPVDMVTNTGRIVLLIEKGQAKRLQTVTSKSGDIHIHITTDADFDVSMATSGLISTDFSMTLDYNKDRTPQKLGVATVGNGSEAIEASSSTGDIKLIRRLGDAKPAKKIPGSGGRS